MVKQHISSWLLCCMLASSVHAQSAPASISAGAERSDASEAQAQFERGLSLSGDERWLEARTAFLSSAQLAPRASTYFNLALVSLELGLGNATLDALERFEKLSDPELHAGFLAQASQLRERAKGIVGTLVLSLDPASAQVRVDGVVREGETNERVLQLDPGVHVIRIAAQGRREQTLEVSIVAQNALHRRVELRSTLAVPASSTPSAATSRAASSARVANTTAPERADTGFFEEPWVWVIAGALVVGAGVTVAVVVLGKDSGSSDPYAGTSGKVLNPSK